MILTCESCHTKNRLPDPLVLDGTYRCPKCKKPLVIREDAKPKDPLDFFSRIFEGKENTD